MNPTSPVIPGLQGIEGRAAEHQPEYITLPVLITVHGHVISRWTFSPEERLRIAEGADEILRDFTGAKHYFRDCPYATNIRAGGGS